MLLHWHGFRSVGSSLPGQRASGEVAEWSKAQHWKCCIGATLSRVRIPPSPLPMLPAGGFSPSAHEQPTAQSPDSHPQEHGRIDTTHVPISRVQSLGSHRPPEPWEGLTESCAGRVAWADDRDQRPGQGVIMVGRRSSVKLSLALAGGRRQVVKAAACGAAIRGFESPRSPFTTWLRPPWCGRIPAGGPGVAPPQSAQDHHRTAPSPPGWR